MKRLGIIVLTTLTWLLPASAQVNVQRMLDIGKNALYYDDYVLSIQYFNLVVNARPTRYDGYYYRGLAKFYLDDFYGADRDITSAIERNPFDSNCFMLRGLIRINTGRYDVAAVDYTKTVELDPFNRSAWHNLILCHMESDSLVQADSVASIMLRKWPNIADAYSLKAQIKIQLKDTLAADSCLDIALEKDRYNVPSLSMKSQILMTQQKYSDAEGMLDEALRIQPKNPGNYINRALCRYHQDNYRGAMTDYDLAIDQDPDNFIGHYNRGLLRANVGEDNLAIEDFNFIISKDPDDMMAIFNRATLLDNTGDYKGAIRDYTTVIDEYPKFLYGYECRGRARRKIGDVKGAVQDEEHVLKEQLAHRYGYSTPTSQQKNKTRKQSSTNIDEYKSLVVADEEDKVYASEIRGKVQNRDVQTTLIRPLARTYSLYREAAPDSALVYFNKAYEEAQNGLMPEAIENLDRAIIQNPYLAEAYYNRGIAKLLIDQTESGIADLSKAGEMGLYSAYNIIKKNQRKRDNEKKSANDSDKLKKK